MREWMAQVDPPRETSTVKKINGRSLLVSPNKMKHYLKEWTTGNGVLKKSFVFKKKNASNRSF